MFGKKTITLSIFLVICLYSYSQKDYSRWYFGYNSGINFNTTPPSFLTDGLVNSLEGCSSLCDTNGNIILYSDGTRFWNNKNIICKNGNDDQFTTYISSTSACAILKHPSISNELFIFHAPYAGYENYGYKYSIYDISNDTINPKYLSLTNPSSEKIAVIDHPNGVDKIITIKQHNNNSYYSYVLTKNGLNTCPVISNSGSIQGPSNSSGQGFMKYSFDGSYFANAMMGDVEKIQLFKVKNIGQFELFRTISTVDQFGYGIEYSRNNKFIYYTTTNLDSSCLYQYEISTSKKITLRKWLNLDKRIFAVQMGQDGKIYVASPDSLYLGVINNPENYGLACNFVSKGFYLGGKKSAYGLPTMNQSYFYTPAINFKYQMECIGNSIKLRGYDTFSANTHNWRITKNKAIVASYNSKNIYHIFSDTGIFDIRYIASNGTRSDTAVKSIMVYSKINKQFLGKDTVYASGTSFSKILKVPYGMYCQQWQDSSGLPTFKADTAGVYICKVTNNAFCEVTDTIIIKECINNLTMPSIYRIRDTLYTYQQLADSFVWFRNNVQYKITKDAFIKLTDTGTYRVEAAKKDHCNRSSTTFRVDKLGIHLIRLQDLSIKLFPNPSNEKVFIQSDNDFKLLITDIAGKVICDTVNATEVNLPKGIYLFRFLVKDSLIVEKVIVW